MHVWPEGLIVTIVLSQVDVRSIEGTFKSLDWEVTTYTDSTVAQIRDIILKEVINIDFYSFYY